MHKNPYSKLLANCLKDQVKCSRVILPSVNLFNQFFFKLKKFKRNRVLLYFIKDKHFLVAIWYCSSWLFTMAQSNSSTFHLLYIDFRISKFLIAHCRSVLWKSCTILQEFDFNFIYFNRQQYTTRCKIEVHTLTW